MTPLRSRVWIVAVVLSRSVPLAAEVRVEKIPGQAELTTVEVHGVAAGAFDPSAWEAGTLHFVSDVRSPLLQPRLSGTWRNIYAPSIVVIPDGWRVFYGAWDGVHTSNDRIYSIQTRDFLDFDDRRIEIEHGTFVHVCNVAAIRSPNGEFPMFCTAYPVDEKVNKPAFFVRPADAGKPHSASPADLITMEGYANWVRADMNGMNVMLFENGVYRLYFGDFRAFGHVYRASSPDGKRFQYEGTCLDAPHMVNDVKKFIRQDRAWYLMALHANRDRLWYALSQDGMKFGPERELAGNLGAEDKYIVAVGWVVRDQQLLGFLYGAGAVPELNRNRIFARWLQKKLVFTDTAGNELRVLGALGPDRQIVQLQGKPAEVRLQIFSEDDQDPLGKPIAVKLEPGSVYRIHVD
ncbi:MAG: hypothetical protein AMXMBFR13_26940 [Phycisphaerae bacterium]